MPVGPVVANNTPLVALWTLGRFAFTGTLGVLLLAKETGLLSSVEEVVKRLEGAGLHLSRSLVDRVLEMAGER